MGSGYGIGAGRSEGRGNCGQDILYERKWIFNKEKKFQLKNKIIKITIKYKLAIDVGSCLEFQHSGGWEAEDYKFKASLDP